MPAFTGCKLFICMPEGYQQYNNAFDPQSIASRGGTSVHSIHEATHVVLHHTAQPEAMDAKKIGVTLCSVVWFFACLEAERPLPTTMHPLYLPFKSPSIDGAARHKPVTLTGFTGWSRGMVAMLLQAAGFPFCKDLIHDTTSAECTAVLVAQDVLTNSAKTDQARVSGIPVVTLHWILDCLQQWEVLTTTDYTRPSSSPPTLVFSPAACRIFKTQKRETNVVVEDSQKEWDNELQTAAHAVPVVTTEETLQLPGYGITQAMLAVSGFAEQLCNGTEEALVLPVVCGNRHAELPIKHRAPTEPSPDDDTPTPSQIEGEAIGTMLLEDAPAAEKQYQVATTDSNNHDLKGGDSCGRAALEDEHQEVGNVKDAEPLFQKAGVNGAGIWQSAAISVNPTGRGRKQNAPARAPFSQPNLEENACESMVPPNRVVRPKAAPTKRVSRKAAPRDSRKRGTKRNRVDSIPDEDQKLHETGGKSKVLGMTSPDHKPASRVHIALSGMHSKEQKIFTEKLDSIGVAVSAGSHEHRPEFTHIIAPALLRNQKCLSAMAGGGWVLGTTFIDACFEARGIVEEEPHELQVATTSGVQPTAARHWRLRCQETGRGAFEGLRFAVDTDLDERLTAADVRAIIAAGGGTAVPLKSAKQVDVVVTKTRPAPPNAALLRLMKKGALCVAGGYVVDWVARPTGPLDEHVLFSSRRNKRVLHAETARGENGVEQAPLHEEAPELSISL